ncbi:GreA/GreB family elongation factor [Maribacter sp.]|uniref:GreA/GreB family elongation factor n=1 Tax=Maribacter sp. TaxID=1897614 RepID=UPI003C750589
MQYGSLVFGKENFVMIKYFQEMNEMYADYAHKNTLDLLTENMSNALIVDTAKLPKDIVQIYSTITVSSKSGWLETFRLVPPYEERIKNGKISVISTLGASVIGLSEGDTLNYGLPGHMMLLRIEKVAQDRKRVKLRIPEEAIKKDVT